jgi:hypothetical protein
MASASAAGAVLTTGAAVEASAGSAGKGILAKLSLGAVVGPMIGLFFAYIGTKAAASTARSARERACILRYTRWAIIPFCFVMSIGLAAVLSQAGRVYTASALGVVLGVSVWVVVLVGGILWLCRRMDREVQQIRRETNTTDEEYAVDLATRGKVLRLPKYIESKTRCFGLPLFAMTWGGYNSDQYRPRTVYGWVAIGDIAVSPFLAAGGVAVAPVAVGAISVGILSLSIFWGLAFGVLAFGSVAFGWWALGCAAAGWRCAVGFGAVARDYAVGMVAGAREANSVAAKEWVLGQWPAEVVEVMWGAIHWWVLLCLVLAGVLRWWKTRGVQPEPVGSSKPQ